MMKVTFHCDICHEEIPQDRSRLISFAFRVAEKGSDLFVEKDPMQAAHHICMKCLGGLHELYLSRVRRS